MSMHHTVPYIAILDGANSTVRKLLAMAGLGHLNVKITTDGGGTASVTVVGNDCTVNMSSIKFDARINSSEADVFTGFIIHEVLHVIHTEMACYQQAHAEDPFLADILNGIEDARMEALELAKGTYPGAASILSRTMTSVHQRAIDMQATNPRPWAMTDLPYFIAILGRLDTGLYNLPPQVAAFRQEVPVLMQPLIDEALRRLPKLVSTQGALTLARSLYKSMKRLEEEQKQAQSGESSEEPRDGDEGEPRDVSRGQADEEDDVGGGQAGEESDADPSETSTSNNGSEKSENTPRQSSGKGGHGESDIFENALEKLVRDHILAGDEKQEYLDPFNHKGALSQSSIKRINKLDMPAVRPASLISQMERLISAPELYSRERFRTHGRFDRRAITRSGFSQSPNVFATRTSTPGKDVSVCVLLDGSSSMLRQMPVARDAAFWISYACEIAGAKTSAAVFQERRLVTMADFGDHINYANFSVEASGGTPMSASILVMADKLLSQPSEKHLMIVITDGGCNLGKDTLTRTVKLLDEENPSLTLAAVGLGNEAHFVKQAFPYSQHLHDAYALNTQGLPFLVDVLEEITAHAA